MVAYLDKLSVLRTVWIERYDLARIGPRVSSTRVEVKLTSGKAEDRADLARLATEAEGWTLTTPGKPTA